MQITFFLWSKQQFEIPEEEAEWVGLSLEEAVEKQRQLEHKVTPLPPSPFSSYDHSDFVKSVKWLFTSSLLVNSI